MRTCSLFAFLMAITLSACKESDPTAPATSTPVVSTAIWDDISILKQDGLDYVGNPQIAESLDNSAIAVWEYGSRSDSLMNPSGIYTSLFTPGSGWSTPLYLGAGSSPRLATNSSGQGVAIWSGNSSDRLEASYYTPGTGWSTATSITSGSNSRIQGFTSITLDADGNAIALWGQDAGSLYSDYSDYSVYSVYSSRFTRSNGWITPVLLETGSGWVGAGRLAINADGVAMALWERFNGSDYSIRVSRFTQGGGWQTPVSIGSTPGGGGPRVVIDNSGNAMVVWGKTAGSSSSIQARRFTALNSTWGPSRAIQTDTSHYNLDPVAGVDAAGNVMVLWVYEGSSRWEIHGNRFRPGLGWGHDFSLNANDTGSSYRPVLAVTSNGRAVAGWQDFDGYGNILQSSYYLPGSGWSLPMVVNPNRSDASMDLNIALDADGKGSMIWTSQQGTGTGRSRYSLLTGRFE